MKVAIVIFLKVVTALTFLNKDLEWQTAGKFPYMVSLRYNGDHMCGGSILDETTIISAANCVIGYSPKYITVVVGSNKLDKSGVTHKIESYVRPIKENSLNKTNDITLIKLTNPIQFNDKVQPVKLRTDYIEGGQNCTLISWVFTNKSYGDELQYIKLKTTTLKECKQTKPVYDSQVCTLAKIDKGECWSGSPLVDSEGRQIGIVSLKTKCVHGSAIVYTRISSFLDWIKNNRTMI